MVCTEAAGRESLALAKLLLTCQVHHEHHSAQFWRVPGGLGLPPAHQALAPGTSLSLSPSPSVPCTHLRRCLTPSWLSWEHQTSGLKWINSHPNHKPRQDSTVRGGPGLLLFRQENASSMVHPKQCSALEGPAGLCQSVFPVEGGEWGEKFPEARLPLVPAPLGCSHIQLAWGVGCSQQRVHKGTPG